MPIQANVTNGNQITATVGETQIDVSVSGGFGPSGAAGAAASVAVGTVTTGAPGSSASVVNAGSSSAAVLNFTIPAGAVGATGPQGQRGLQGEQGIQGIQGQAGATGATGATGPAGTTTWAGITDKPSTFAPSTHTHTASQISDFTSAVIAAAPPTVDASLLTQGTLPDARLSSNIARTSDVTAAVANVVNAAPASLDTLKELADALGNDASFSSTVTNSLATKAPLASPTFTGTVSGVTKAMVGLGNVDNTSDASKPVSTAQAAADAAVASAAASDATSKANAAQAAAVQRANHTGTQAISTVDGLQTALDGKQASGSYAAVTHSHAIGDVTGLQTAIDGKAALGHAHSALDVTSGVFNVARLPVGTTSTTVAAGNDARFTDARIPTDGSVTDAKITSGGLSASSINWVAIAAWQPNTAYAKGDLVSFQGVAYRRTTAGTSGATFATAMWQAVTPSEFVASQITSGTVAAARLGSGSPSSANFLRGDGTWAAAGSSSASDLTSGTLAYARMADPTVTSPSQITGNQNDYAGCARGVNRISSDAARNITGMAAGSDGEVRVIVNVGSFAITFVHQSTSSTAANRLLVSFGADYLLASNAAVVAIYDNTTARWRLV